MIEKQIHEYKEAFALWDGDKDGKVGASDIGTMMRSLGMNPTEAEIRQIVKEIPGGKVDLPSFLKIMQKANTTRIAEKEIIEAFKVFDPSNTGFISIAELRHVLTILGEKLTNEEVHELIKEADDGTGRVNYKNYTKLLIS